ncbi:MAG TPA: hypothetical protein PLN30_00375 [Ferruginibacter sp.]|nr:hypothetical protein [Ferruginibacter sp.]
MSSTPKERLREFINYQRLSIRDFSKKCGFSHSILTGNSSIQSDKLALIAKNFPELSLNWIITGNGSMINKEKFHVGGFLLRFFKAHGISIEQLSEKSGYTEQSLKEIFASEKIKLSVIVILGNATGFNLVNILYPYTGIRGKGKFSYDEVDDFTKGIIKAVAENPNIESGEIIDGEIHSKSKPIKKKNSDVAPPGH